MDPVRDKIEHQPDLAVAALGVPPFTTTGQQKPNHRQD
jgi:hypothetical protein